MIISVLYSNNNYFQEISENLKIILHNLCDSKNLQPEVFPVMATNTLCINTWHYMLRLLTGAIHVLEGKNGRNLH